MQSVHPKGMQKSILHDVFVDKMVAVTVYQRKSSMRSQLQTSHPSSTRMKAIGHIKSIKHGTGCGRGIATAEVSQPIL